MGLETTEKDMDGISEETRPAQSNHTASLPNKLRIVDGEIVCADGTDAREYLRDFARRGNVDCETPIVVMRRDGHESDRWHAHMMRNWGA